MEQSGKNMHFTLDEISTEEFPWGEGYFMEDEPNLPELFVKQSEIK
jgi:hypothetical protein